MSNAVVIDEDAHMAEVEAFAASKVDNSKLKPLKGVGKISGVAGYIEGWLDGEETAFRRLENLLVDRRGRRDEKHSHVKRATNELIQDADGLWADIIALYSGLEILDDSIKAVAIRTDSWGRNPRLSGFTQLPPAEYHWYYDYQGGRREYDEGMSTEFKPDSGSGVMPTWFLTPSKKARETVVWVDIDYLKSLTTAVDLFTAKCAYTNALAIWGNCTLENTHPANLYSFRKNEYLVNGNQFTHEQWEEILNMDDYDSVEGTTGALHQKNGMWYWQRDKNNRWGYGYEDRGWYAQIPLGMPWKEGDLSAEQDQRLRKERIRAIQAKSIEVTKEIEFMKQSIPELEAQLVELGIEAQGHINDYEDEYGGYAQ